MRAADSAPPDERSGVKACRPSNADPKTMRAPPTTSGRGQARQTIIVIASLALLATMILMHLI